MIAIEAVPALKPSHGASTTIWFTASMRPGSRRAGVITGRPASENIIRGTDAAFLLDPDGNNIEAVNHGPAKRSADAVVVTAEM